MSTVLVVLLLVGFMVMMSRAGKGCCGGHSKHEGHSNQAVKNSRGGCCGEHPKDNVTKLHGRDSAASEKTD